MIRGRIHTDLALEAKERYEEDNVEIRGVCIEEEYNEEKDIRTTLVKIETENGARAMGRPQGNYLTLEAPNLSIPDEGYHREISEELARQVKKLIPEKKELTVLVVGLGCGGQFKDDPPYNFRIWCTGNGRTKYVSSQRARSGGDGADWNGDT